ncbi:MAG: PEP-CTERM sorting domain-containing protein, partial [Acetobacteraceae bacterium]
RGLQLALSGPSGGAGDSGGAVGVPEPGAFGLMCLGLALIGGGLGRRRWRDAVPMRIRRASDPKTVARTRRRRSRHG